MKLVNVLSSVLFLIILPTLALAEGQKFSPEQIQIASGQCDKELNALIQDHRNMLTQKAHVRYLGSDRYVSLSKKQVLLLLKTSTELFDQPATETLTSFVNSSSVVNLSYFQISVATTTQAGRPAELQQIGARIYFLKDSQLECRNLMLGAPKGRLGIFTGEGVLADTASSSDHID